MNYPRLLDSFFYDSSKYSISRNGIGVLSDATDCAVTEEMNGVFTLTMTYPVGGIHWLDIDVGMYIVCQPNEFADEQPFLIKKISKAMGGSVKIDAEHISYNASGIMVSGFNAGNSGAFRTFLNEEAVNNVIGISFGTDIKKSATHIGIYKPPRSMRSLLLDKDDSFVSLYGGEFEFNGLSIFAHQRRGADRGVTIRYGKNLTALTQTRNIRDFATSGYPYWYKSNADGTRYVDLPEKILHYGVAEYSDIEKTELIDLSSKFDSAPSESELRSAATEWINDNWKSSPPYSITLSFVDLSKTTEYANIAAAEKVMIGDTITVIQPEMNIGAKLRVVKTVYDVLQNRYKSIGIGDPVETIADTIIKISGGK